MKTIIIPGILRSGTSLTSQIVQALGVNFGNDFQPPDEFNPYGYFENKAFRKLNDEILGGDRYNVPLKPQAITKFADKAKALIKTQKEKLGSIWGWKEVKTALTLSVYYPYLDNPYIIICERDDNQTAKSFARIESFHLTEKDALEIVKLHKKSLNEFIEKEKPKVLKLKFEDFFKENGLDNQVKKISDFLDIKIPKDFKDNIIFDARIRNL